MNSQLTVRQLQEYHEQLNKLDELLTLHQQHGGSEADFMISQYIHCKEQIIKSAVVESVEVKPAS